jgi:hypothetical protein
VKVRDKIEAGALALSKVAGWRVPKGHRFEDDENPRGRDYWRMSLAAWKAFTGKTADLDANIRMERAPAPPSGSAP